MEFTEYFRMSMLINIYFGLIKIAYSFGNVADADIEHKLREEFAKTCFETLLQFSLLDGLESGELREMEGGLAGRLAVTALLTRFQDVLHQFVEDERRSGKCPLPR